MSNDPGAPRLGSRLRCLRGDESPAAFAERLGVEVTFLHEVELGVRLPEDEQLARFARRLAVDPGELILLAYLDRSPLLASYLAARGIDPDLDAPNCCSFGGSASD
ncbi:MAG: helix-turn-helix transcriptional regulator [Planctomycetes bacterium]|nr:helix-turn-helix transcriptional regulator [Planctomycetota bacterium]